MQCIWPQSSKLHQQATRCSNALMLRALKIVALPIKLCTQCECAWFPIAIFVIYRHRRLCSLYERESFVIHARNMFYRIVDASITSVYRLGNRWFCRLLVFFPFSLTLFHFLPRCFVLSTQWLAGADVCSMSVQTTGRLHGNRKLDWLVPGSGRLKSNMLKYRLD